MTIQEFIDKNHIGFTSKRIDHRPDNLMDDNMRHFKCTIKHNKIYMIAYFSQGSAHFKDPTCADVLGCLASDCQGFSSYSFEDWASELGMDTDSRKAEKTYKAIGKQYDALLRVLRGDLFNELLECEAM